MRCLNLEAKRNEKGAVLEKACQKKKSAGPGGFQKKNVK